MSWGTDAQLFSHQPLGIVNTLEADLLNLTRIWFNQRYEHHTTQFSRSIHHTDRWVGRHRSRTASAQKKPPRILLRSSWQIVNIGDIAHTPGVLALIEKYLPEADGPDARRS